MTVQVTEQIVEDYVLASGYRLMRIGEGAFLVLFGIGLGHDEAGKKCTQGLGHEAVPAKSGVGLGAIQHQRDIIWQVH